jgi:hypothetical protein
MYFWYRMIKTTETKRLSQNRKSPMRSWAPDDRDQRAKIENLRCPLGHICQNIRGVKNSCSCDQLSQVLLLVTSILEWYSRSYHTPYAYPHKPCQG